MLYTFTLLAIAAIPFAQIILPILGISVAMITGIIAIIIWISYIMSSHRLIKLPPFILSLFMYLVSVILSVIIRSPFNYANYAIVRRYVALILLVILLYNVINSPKKFYTSLYILSFSFAFYTAISLILFLIGSPYYSRITAGTHRLDFLGQGMNVNTTGQYIIALLPMQFPLYKITNSILIKLFIIISIFIWVISLLFIESRTVIVTLLIIAVFYIIFSFRKAIFRINSLQKICFVIVIFCITLIPIFNIEYWERFKNLPLTRFLYWKMAFHMFCQNWLFGVGAGKFGDVLIKLLSENQIVFIKLFTEVDYFVKNAAAHNMFLNVLAETGLIGFLSFIFFLKHVFSIGINGLKYNVVNIEQFYLQNLLLYLILGILAFLIAGVFLSGERSHLLYILTTAIAINTRLILKCK